MHWKIIEDLIKKCKELVSYVSSKTDALLNDETKVKDPDDENDVDNFLKQPSLMKKKSKNH